MLTWFGPQILHVAGTNALVLRGGILLAGCHCRHRITSVGSLLEAFHAGGLKKSRPGRARYAGASGGLSGASQDVDILIRDAAGKVAAARLGCRRATCLRSPRSF